METTRFRGVPKGSFEASDEEGKEVKLEPRLEPKLEPRLASAEHASEWLSVHLLEAELLAISSEAGGGLEVVDFWGVGISRCSQISFHPMFNKIEYLSFCSVYLKS